MQGVAQVKPPLSLSGQVAGAKVAQPAPGCRGFQVAGLNVRCRLWPLLTVPCSATLASAWCILRSPAPDLGAHWAGQVAVSPLPLAGVRLG